MPYLDTDTIKSFFKSNSWLTVEDESVSGAAELISQIDSIIFNKTGVPIPVSPGDAPGIIRNVACALFVWYSSGKQGDISSDERMRREKLYNDAMDYLNAVEAGDKQVFDDDGNIVSTENDDISAYFESTQRITEMP